MTDMEQDRYGGGSRPVPDPTLLTTQQLLREIFSLKELIFTRIDGMDKGITLLQSQADKVPSIAVVNASVEALRQYFEEKFHSISIQFTERDTRTESSARDSKVAVDAALQAAKEAVGEQNKSSALSIAKSEAATTKQIDQISLIINATTKGTDDKIDDLKTRLTAMEGARSGGRDAGSVVVQVIAAIASLGFVLMIIVSVVLYIASYH